MDTTTNAGHDPREDPGVEARLRVELGQGALPPDVRHQQLERLQALAAELRTTQVADGDRPAAERARRRWFTHAIQSRAAAASVAVCAVLVLGTGSAVAASADALPGEALHHVKRTVEQVQLAAAWSPSATVEVYLRVAQARLDEAARLVGGDREAAQLPTVVEQHAAALAAAAEHAAGDPELTARVEQATATAAARLAALLDDLPASASPHTRQTLDRAAERLRPTPPAEPDSPSEPGRQPQQAEPDDGQPDPPAPDQPGEDPDDPTTPEHRPGADPAEPPARDQHRQDDAQPEGTDPSDGTDRPDVPEQPDSDDRTDAADELHSSGRPVQLTSPSR